MVYTNKMWYSFAFLVLCFKLSEANPMRAESLTNRSPAHFKVFHERSTDSTLHASVETFGKTHHLTLQRVLMPSLRMFELVMVNGKLVVQEIKPNKTETEHYHDKKTGSLFYRNENNALEGMLSDEIAIRHSDNQHFASKFEPSFISERKIDDLQAEKSDVFEEEDDTIAEEDGEVGNETEDEVNFLPQARSNTTYTVELLVIVDSKLSKDFESSAYMSEYLRIYFMMVDRRFRPIRSVDIRVVITGVVISRSYSTDRAMLAVLGTDEADISLSNKQFSSYLASYRNFLPKHDVAHLLTKRNLAYKTSTSSDTSFKYEGIARTLACPCPYVSGNQALNSGLSEDDGYYKGMLMTTRILAHNLGARLDGDGNSCPSYYGYIMSDNSYSSNARKFCFSSCAQSSIVSTVQRFRSCLQTQQNTTEYELIDYFPGTHTTLTQQCKDKTGNPNAHAAHTSSSQCYRLQCRIPVDGQLLYHTSWYPALEGTRCSYNGFCNHGRCMSTMTVPMD